MIRAVLLIVAKDLRLRLRDRTVYLVGIVAPLGLALILHASIGDALDGDLSIDLAVVDHDQGEISQRFVDVLQGLEELDIQPVLDLDQDEAMRQVEDGDVSAALVIPAGFTDAVMSPEGVGIERGAGVAGAARAQGAEGVEEAEGDRGGDPRRIQVVGNVDQEIGTEVATAIADGFVDRVNAGRLSVATAMAISADPAHLEDLVGEAMAAAPPVTVRPLPADDRQLDGSTYLMAGMSIMFLFFTVQLGVTGLLEEQRLGTLARLRAAPIPRLAIPLAKAGTSAILGLVSMAVLIVASTVIMGADWGDPMAVVVLAVAAVLAAIAIMGVVAALARTPEQAGSYQSIIVMVLAVMGGSFFPVTQGNDLLTRVAGVTPNHWFLRGLGEGQAEGLTGALPAVGMLLAFAVVVGSVGAVALARRER